MLSLKTVDWGKTGLVCVVLLAVASIIYNWYRPPNTVTNQTFVPVPQIQNVEKIRTVEVPVEKVVVVEKEKVINVIKNLPPEVKGNPNTQITATATLDATKTGYDVVSTIDLPSGKSSIVAKEKEQPFLGFPNNKEIGIRYGVDTRAGQSGVVYGRWQFLRAGNAELGAYGEMSTTPDAKITVDLSYKF